MNVMRNSRGAALVLAGLSGLVGSTIASAEQRPRWLAIVAPGLVEAVQPLAERRRDEGFEVQLRTVAKTDNPEAQLTWVKSQAADSSTPTYLTLVGDWFAVSENCYVPPAVGRHGRMRGHPTDFAYALPTAAGEATMAVGRLPARSPDELRAMIAKIVRFEDQAPGPWSNRVNLWVGHPGGHSAIEKKLAESVVHSTIGSSLAAIPPVWDVRTLADFPGTRYTVPSEEFADRVADEFEYGQCFSVYAGHSGASGWWSGGRYVVPRDALASVRIEHSPGVFVTTGCYACQLAGSGGQGYLLAALRNPDGPVACMGAFGESYAAHGQLVMDALLYCLTTEHVTPKRLAFHWMAAQRGIARGPLSPLKFWLYDQADGSRGSVPLAAQRREHLEMWTLLGDPALRIPSLGPTLEVAVARSPQDAKKLRISTDFPADFTTGKVSIRCRVGPARGSQNASDSVEQERDMALDFAAAGRGFDRELELADALDDRDVVVRVYLSSGADGWLGIGKSPAADAVRPAH